MQVTLVAYYGKKPPIIEGLIRSLQEELSHQLGSAFEPYQVEQVHATIIGLEAFREGAELVNLNFKELRGERRPMNLGELLSFIVRTSRLPFEVQIGGFSPAMTYPFTSRTEHPYFRSFSLQGTIAVAMGWPVSDDSYPRHLDSLRRCFNDCNVLHKYHRNSADLDNDLFFVLGRVERSLLTECQIQDMQDALRDKCATMEPIRVPVVHEYLSLVLYEDPQLPWGRAESISLSKAKEELAKVARSYPREGT